MSERLSQRLSGERGDMCWRALFLALGMCPKSLASPLEGFVASNAPMQHLAYNVSVLRNLPLQRSGAVAGV